MIHIFATAALILTLTVPARVAGASDRCIDQYLASEPVSFRQKQFWVDGKLRSVWDLGSRSAMIIDGDKALVTANIMYRPVYSNGDSAGRPIITHLPCHDGYSDAWVVMSVGVVDDLDFDSVRSEEVLKTVSINLPATILGFYNMPIVPKDSFLVTYRTDLNTTLTPAWMSGQEVYFLDMNFGNITSAVYVEGRNKHFIQAARFVTLKDSRSIFSSGVVEHVPISDPSTSFYRMMDYDRMRINKHSQINSFSEIEGLVQGFSGVMATYAYNYPFITDDSARYNR